MSILEGMDDDEKRLYRQKKLKEMHDYNEDLIKDLGISKSDFNMKKAFTRNGTIVVGIFDSEFKRPKGFYFELINSDIEPDDPARTVYRLSPTEFYADEFEMDEYGKYLVPVDQLRIVNRQSAVISKGSAATSSDRVLKDEPTLRTTIKPPLPFTDSSQLKVEDAPFSEMTIRDYLAIHTGKPVSTKSWLNELIKIK
jgi:hypothetical protein